MPNRDKCMILLYKIFVALGSKLWVLVVAGLVSPLAGCINAPSPILSDANAILGEQGEIHFFSAPGSGPREHSVMNFEWSGSRYVFSGRSGSISDFTAHPFEGRDLIVQSTAARAPRLTEYAIARKLADGVYMVFPINEDDVDEATRARFCTKTQVASCRITTPEQLFVFAKATAAKDEEAGGIAVIVPTNRR
jgi:hypothetical protein